MTAASCRISSRAWPTGWLRPATTTFLLVALAEFGDKSQLVCMTLAARHRGLPVVIGAIAAFAILNLLAVLFGAAVAAWLPEWMVIVAVAVLFARFGISALRYKEEEDDDEVEEKPGHGIVATTFLLIFVAEFGDKTQLAVAGLGSTGEPSAVWAGATLALATTSDARRLRRPQAAQPPAAALDPPDQRRLLPAAGDLRRNPPLLSASREVSISGIFRG